MTDAKQALQRLDAEVPSIVKPPPSVAEILMAVVDKGVTAENVAAVKEVVALYERMEEKKAERDFAQAFSALQGEMKRVKATRAVPNNDGTTRYCFAPYEEIMAQVQPLLEKHGFTVSFSTEFDDKRLVKSCTLTHIGGASRTNKFAVRIGSGPPKASESQADGAASTYAKRFALCDALNIIVDVDTDARAEGGTITKEQADELERRVNETNSDQVAFLKLAGATTYAEIRAAKYEILDELLAKKERRGR